MGNLTNVSAEPLQVAPLNKRVIDPGETVDVPDYLLAEYAWPAATWKVDGSQTVELVGDAYTVPPPKPAPKKAAAAKSDSKE